MSIHSSLELFHLMSFPKMTRKKVQNYLLIDPQLTRIRQLEGNELSRYFSLPLPIAKSLQQYLSHTPMRKHHENRFFSLNPLTIYDEDYPTSLASIPDPPLILYTRGNRELLKHHLLSVIGSRKPSPNAKKKIDFLLPPLIHHDISIVSGLAYGIDSMSHRITLEEKGKTIAVLAFGFNHIYPASHVGLYQAIEKEGLLVTEYPPETKPQRWQFPERNRIISGLSQATLIIEAAIKSGTMITADQALEQGKEVFVVPDSIFLPEAAGCLKLLQEGATPVAKPEDLLNSWSSIGLKSI